MTYWARPRPFKADQRARLSARLRAIADQLDADHAQGLMDALAAAADPTPWPTTTGGGGSSSGPSSPVERAVTATKRTDTQGRAATTLADLHQLDMITARVDPSLEQWSSVRVIARCHACGFPLRPNKRCPECNTRAGATPCCDDCGKEQDRAGLRPWPTRDWAGYTDGVARMVCLRDWMWRHRHDGLARNGVERLAIGAGVIGADDAMV